MGLKKIKILMACIEIEKGSYIPSPELTIASLAMSRVATCSLVTTLQRVNTGHPPGSFSSAMAAAGKFFGYRNMSLGVRALDL